MRAVVVGGTGHLGRAVVTALDGAGFAVTPVARNPGVGARVLDATDVVDTAAQLAELRPDVVVNAAGALWSVDEQQMRSSNALLPRRLVSALDELAAPPWLVHIGSTYEYGSPEGGRPIDEHTPTAPTGVYGRSKLEGSTAVLAWARPAAVLRCSTVAGSDAPPGSLLATVARSLRERAGAADATLDLPPLFGIRDFVDMRDVTAAVLAACRSRADGVFNIASGVPASVPGVVDRLVRISGVRVQVRTAAPPAGLVRDSGVGDHRIDVSRAAAVLGWTPRRGIDEMLAALWSDTTGTQAGLAAG